MDAAGQTKLVLQCWPPEFKMKSSERSETIDHCQEFFEIDADSLALHDGFRSV